MLIQPIRGLSLMHRTSTHIFFITIPLSLPPPFPRATPPETHDNEVSNAKAVTEASIAQLRTALTCARRTTVARAMALAGACRVEPPRALLARRVNNEHREKLMGRGEIDEYVEVQSGATSAQAVAAGEGVGRLQVANGNLGTLHSRPLKSELAGCRSGASNTTPTSASHPTVVADVDAHSRGASVAAVGKGWNREWSRSVDAWCRKTCARFREKFAEDAVRSARRLLWLARGGGGGAEFFRGNRSRRCNVGIEGWAALAKFGDVPDFLELLGSTAELIVSVDPEESVILGGDGDELSSPTQILRKRQAEQLLGTEVRDPPLTNSKQEERDQFAGANAEAAVLEKPGDSTKSRKDDCADDDEVQGVTIPEVGGTTAPTDTNVRLLDTETEPSHDSSAHGVGTGSAAGRVSGPHRRRRVSPPGKLLPVTEQESDSDDEQSNDEDNLGNNHKPDTSNRSVSLRDNTNTVVGHRENSTTAMVDSDQGDKGGGRGGGGFTNNATAVTTTLNSHVTRTSRIILAPATVESALGVPSLSFFVLQVARRQTQRRPTTAQIPTFGCDSTVNAVAVANEHGAGLPTKGHTSNTSSRTRGFRTGAIGHHRKTGNSSSEDGNAKNIALGGSYASTTDESSEQSSGDTCTPQTTMFDVELGSEVARFLPQREKQGLANAVETLILPRLRISSPTTNVKSATGVGKKAWPRLLRLHLELPDDRKAQVRENGTPGPPAVGSKMKAVRPAAPEIGKGLASSDTATGIAADVVTSGTKRFLQSPVYRWVGRVDGRRCLLSCPASQLNSSALRLLAGHQRAAAAGVGRVSNDIATATTDESAARDDCSTPTRDDAAASADNTFSTAGSSPLVAEKLKTRGSALPADTNSATPGVKHCRGCNGHTRRRVQAIFVGGGLYTTPPVPRRQLQERCRVAGAQQQHSTASSTVSRAVLPSEHLWKEASLGFALNNPLCSNCGHRAFRRFIEDATYLLLLRPPQSSSPSWWPEISLKLPLRHAAGGGEFRQQERADGDNGTPQLTDRERRDDHGDDSATYSVVTGRGGRGRGGATKNRSSRAAVYDDDRGRTVVSEFSRRLGEEHNGGGVGKLAAGRLADWVCRNGKICFCSRCLQPLRSCKVPLHRVSCGITTL